MVAERIDPIQEEVSCSKKRARAIDLYYALAGDTAVHKRDLAPKAIDCLDRTELVAKGAMAQIELASPSDQLRAYTDVSKEKPAGTEDVIKAASSTGLTRRQSVKTVFDLAGNPKQEGVQRTQRSTEATSLSRPVLELPKDLVGASKETAENYLKVILDMHGSMEKVIADCTHHLDQETRRDLQDLKLLREEKVHAIEEYTRELATQESWATLQNIARYLAYASSLAIGVMMINSAAAGAAAYFLIAAGGLGIVSSLASDAKLWNAMAAHLSKSQETQRHIVQSIELATTLIAVGLGLIGSCLGSPTQVPTAFAWISGAVSAYSKLGQGWSEKKYSEIVAQLEELERKILMLQEHTKNTSNHMQNTLLMAKKITEEVERILSNGEIHVG